MSSPLPFVTSGSNLSHVWGTILLHAMQTGGSEINCLVASINGFEEDGSTIEDPDIRKALDKFLASADCWSTEIVAFTIFPQRYLLISDGDRYSFYETYFDALPHIKAKNPQLNGRGLYFERLTKFGCGKETD